MSKFLSSVRWIFLTTILRRLLVFLLFLYLSKEFTKADLGVFRELGLILCMFTLVGLFSSDSWYVIFKNEAKPITLLQIAFFTGIPLTILSFFTSYWIGYAYHSLYLGKILYYGSFFLFFEAFRVAIKSIYVREMNFKIISIAETANVVFYTIVSFVILLLTHNFTVFIVSFYIGNLLELIILLFNQQELLLRSFKRMLHWDELRNSLQILHSRLSFLVTATLTRGFNFITGESPVILLGLFYSPKETGLYYTASQFVALPVMLVTGTLSQAIFPLFSNSSAEELKQRFHRFLFIVIQILWPLLICYSFLIYRLVPLYLGQEYKGISTLILWLSFNMAFVLLMNPISSIPNIMNKPQWELGWSVISFVIRNLAIIIIAKQFTHAVQAYIIASVVIQVLFDLLSARLIGFSIIKVLTDIGRGGIPMVLMVLLFYLLRNSSIVFALCCYIFATLLLLIIKNLYFHGRIFREIHQLIQR